MAHYIALGVDRLRLTFGGGKGALILEWEWEPTSFFPGIVPNWNGFHVTIVLHPHPP
jgi:hypothetical protein